EAADLRSETGLGNRANPFLLSLGGYRKARLYYIDAQSVQRLGYLQLLLGSERDPWGLFPITERCVEDAYRALAHSRISFGSAATPVLAMSRTLVLLIPETKSSICWALPTTSTTAECDDESTILTACFFCISPSEILSVFIFTSASSL